MNYSHLSVLNYVFVMSAEYPSVVQAFACAKKNKMF